MLLQVPNKAKVNKDDLAKLLKVDPRDIYIEDKDFAAYSSLFYVDELPERADPVAYNLKDEIDFGNRTEEEIYDLIEDAIKRIPESIKMSMIRDAVDNNTSENLEDCFDNYGTIDNIDNYLTEFLLNNQNYIFPEED